MILESYFSALRFLTVLPIPEKWCGNEDAFQKSPGCYPLVGLTIGIFLALLDVLLCQLLPIAVASSLLLMAMIAISGALHLDGLADTADAFFSSRGREQMLDIMKDSRSGPMGVTAIVFILLMKLALLLSLPVELRRQAILLMPLAGRSILPFISSLIPYARQNGTAAFTRSQYEQSRSLRSLLLLLLSAVLLLGWASGLVITAFTCFGGWLLAFYSRRKIGGFTGDTLGASCELVELLPALCLVAFVHLGIQ